MAQKLEVMPTIREGILYGIKNIVSLILMVILYVLTIWIPWINVGTTIGIYKAVIGMGRGEVINPIAIFDKENRQNVGDFFLLLGLQSMGVAGASAFMFIPGIVVGLAWGFAVYFLIDKKLSPMKCLKVSYKVTDGEKWTIFWIGVLTCIIFGLVGGILFGLSSIKYVGWLFAILGVAVYLVMFAAMLAIEGVMYKHFSAKADAMFADKIDCGCHPHGPKAPEAPVAPAPAPEEPSAPEE